MKHPGLYVPLDVNYVHDEAVRRAGPQAELLFLRGLAYAKRVGNDGFIPDYDLPVVGVGLPDVNNAVERLVHWDLWREEEGGWRIRSWERWNASDEHEQERRREAARERKRRQREREAEERRAAQEAAGADTDEVLPGQLQVVPDPDATEEDNRDVTRDMSRGHAPQEKRREEKKKTPPSPAGEGRKTATRTPPSYEETPEFVEFYDAYPRKKERRDACKAWHQALKRGADPEAIIAAAHRYAAETRGRDKDRIKYPAAWLRAGAYDDAPEPPAKASGGSPWRGGGAHATTPTHEDFKQGRTEVTL